MSRERRFMELVEARGAEHSWTRDLVPDARTQPDDPVDLKLDEPLRRVGVVDADGSIRAPGCTACPTATTGAFTWSYSMLNAESDLDRVTTPNSGNISLGTICSTVPGVAATTGVPAGAL